MANEHLRAELSAGAPVPRLLSRSRQAPGLLSRPVSNSEAAISEAAKNFGTAMSRIDGRDTFRQLTTISGARVAGFPHAALTAIVTCLAAPN